MSPAPGWLRPAMSVGLFAFLFFTTSEPCIAQVSVQGQWQTLPYTMPINPVHVALLRNGKVLIVSGSGNVPGNSNFQAGLWDPQAGTIATQPLGWDMFCNGMSVLPDGRPFVMGGTLQYDPFHGELRSSTYDPDTNTFTDQQSMAHGRWYPTSTILSDGRVMVFSGLNETGGTNTSVEFYSAGSGWSAALTAPWTPPLYPRMHLLPNGKVFYSGPTTTSSLFNPATNTWTTNIATTNYSGTRTYGTSVLLPLTPANNYTPKVIIMGGGSPSTNTTELIDLSAATPKWVSGPHMSQPRIEMDATILPNGKILALGGSLNDEDTATASLNADLYDPAANTFSSASAEVYARLYHSVSLLLPDATVWVAGGNPQRGTYEPHMEIYSPAYLFNADGSRATRPSITGLSSSTVGYGGALQVQTPDAANISSVVLIRNGAVTHAFDMDQRYVGLSFTVGSGILNITGPPNANIAPPGYYMLFVLNNSGVPSIAQFVQVSINPGDFALSFAPLSQSVAQGNTTSYTMNVIAGSGFSGSVGFATTGLPSGATASFNPTAVTTSGSTTMTISTASNTPTGSFALTVTGTSGSLTHSVAPALQVIPLADTQPPTAPGNLTASVISNQEIDLAWAASTDNVGVTSYAIERCQASGCTSFVQIATVGSVISYNDTTLSASTSYSYRVRASDAAGNISPYSNIVSATTLAAPPGAVLIQHVGKDAGTTTSSSLAFPANNTAGNWIAVAIRAGSSGQTFTVTDSRGNAYKPAVVLNVSVDTPVGDTLGIFYAENITGGANTVTVSDSLSGSTLRFAIMEYSGVATTNSLDVSSASQGVGTAAISGTLTTTASSDLLLGVFVTSDPATFTPGSGYTLRDTVPAAPNGKLITEDQIQAIAGVASATASLSVSDKWGGGLAAFKAAIGTGGTSPTITSVNPTSGSVGSPVGIAGSNFGATQGTSSVSFNGTPAGTASSWSAASISTPVPAGAASGNVVVTVGGMASNSMNFTVTTPTINSISPSSGPIGTLVTINGVNFGTSQGTSSVSFNGTPGGTAPSWSATSISIPVPVGATSGNVVVTVGGVVSNSMNFTVTAPTINTISPGSGPVGTSVTINGVNFGASQGASSVNFNGTPAGTATSWGPTSISIPVPAGATSGNVTVIVGGLVSNAVSFTVTTAPGINSISPGLGPVGTSITINGVNFGLSQSSSSVTFNGTTAFPTSWSDTAIQVPVPSGATSGKVVVTVGGLLSNGVSFTVTAANAGIKLVQHLGKDAGTVSSTSLAFPASNSAGNFIAVVVRVGRSGQTLGVSDTHANIYKQAALLNMTKDGETLAIFYSENIAGGANTVTLSQTLSPAGTLRFAMLEYSGVALSASLDNSAAAEGTGTAANSGNAVTTFGDLILGEITSSNTANFVAGSGYNAEDFVPAEPNTKLLTEDQTQAAGGNAAVTASLGVTDDWGAILAAFRPAVAQTPDTTAPTVSITVPATGITVSGTIALTATATDTDSPVSFVQFQMDGANIGIQLTSPPYSTSLDTTTLTNGPHVLTAVAKDPTGNQGSSTGVSLNVSNAASPAMGPLKQSTVNSRYFVAPAGNAVFLSGSHTWDDLQDFDTSGSVPAAFDFNAYMNFLKAHDQNTTILWHMGPPQFCGWDVNGSAWRVAPWPWLRIGPGVATDGNPKFDLTQFNQAYFDRLRARALQLQQNNIYSIVNLFNAELLATSRCSTDGYPFTGANNVNAVDDGYTSGSCGVGSVTMTTNNAITNFQDAYVKKVIDTLNDLPNVLWELAEEQPGTSFSTCPGYGGASSMTFWAPHMFGLINTYESGGAWEGITYPGKPFQHPVGIASMNYGDRALGDAPIYGSTATWIAPMINGGVNKFPSNVPVNNQGKVVINDSDHALGWPTFLNSDGSVQNQNLRGYLWENLTSGAEGVLFMDPYEVFWQGPPLRNTCPSPVNQICSSVDAKYEAFRFAMGYLQNFVNSNLNLLRMTPQASLASTGFCLADNSATGAEYVVYAPIGGTFTVNLSATTHVLNVQWLNPATGAVTTGSSVTGGSTLSFTPPFSGDAVLYLTDAAGHN